MTERTLLIVLFIFFLFGGGYSWRSNWGNGPTGIFGILIILILLRFLGVF